MIVNNDANAETHQFFPVINVTPSGIVVLSWYDQRDDAANVNARYYMAYSTDGGSSFQEQFPVSTDDSDFSIIGRQNDGFGVGEYTQVVSTERFAIPFWADGRGNDGEVKVYTGKVDLEDAVVTGLQSRQSLSSLVQLEEPFPNPVTNELSLNWYLTSPASVSWSVVDNQGKESMAFAPTLYDSGRHQKKVIVANLSSGVYYLKFRAGADLSIHKFVVVK